jgi:hypothetical protein
MFKIISTCKGGGYMYCRTIPTHPKANSKGLYPLHRVLMENKLGRLLKKGEDVHHADEDKNNNDPDNLEVLTKSEHGKEHKKTLPLVKCVCPNPNCKKKFKITGYALRLRKKRNKTGKVFCSRKCGGEAIKFIKNK